MEIGVECETELISDVVFRDIDIIHFDTYAISVANGNEAKISDILYEDIRIYTSDACRYFMQMNIAETFWAPGDQRRTISGITLRDLSLDQPRPSHFSGFSEVFTVRNIVFDGIEIGGKRMADVPRFL